MRLRSMIFLLLFAGVLAAQADMHLRQIDSAAWERASGKLDYSKDVPKEQRPKPKDISGPDWTLNTGLLGNITQALAILVAIGVIGYGVYRMLQAPRNKKVARDGVEITLDNLDQYLDETDLDQFLQAALADKNYALAIRLYYLQMIKSLASRNDIQWSREKTNKDYLREMREHRLSTEFQRLTAQYERVWYGDQRPDAAAFATMEPTYRKFLQQISI